MPDETTILRFRHLLEKHGLTAAILGEIRSLLEEKQLLLKTGTIVDATIISAPISTKRREGAWDPEMKQTKTGNTWYVGIKVHVCTDKRGLTHTPTVTEAVQADVHQLLHRHGEQQALYRYRAYWSEPLRQHYDRPGVRFRVNRRASASRPVSDRWREINRGRSRIRSRGEQSFHVVKRTLWGFRNLRGSRRTPLEPSPCSRWRTSTWCAGGLYRRGRRARFETNRSNGGACYGGTEGQTPTHRSSSDA